MEELSKPSFDLLAWIRWRRMNWVGKALRGEKGRMLFRMLQWNHEHRYTGDIYQYLPGDLPSSFLGLVQAAKNKKDWQRRCQEMKPPKWTRYDANGNAEPRRSKRLAANGGHGRSNKRARRRYYLRLQLRGRHATKWPAPSDIPHGDVHVYTDGSATTKLGQKKAGFGVWFAEGSPLNISTGMRGRQTSNRAELTAIVLTLCRARD